MSLPYRKKLIEVSLPLAAINAESAREKSIRHGHPSTLHLWWARRPLAACRAVLFSSLVDDPDSDPQYLNADGAVDEETAGIKRADLFNLIEELVMWENSNNSDVIRTARAEIARCVASRLIETGVLKKETVIGEKTTAYNLVTRGHCRPIPLGLDKKVGRVRFSFDVSTLPPAEVVNAFLAEHAPPVLDPFAGGGSIPLEAQRLGLRAHASDLNPVPVLINKALIEIPPKFAGRPPVNPDARGGLTASKGKVKKTKKVVEHDWPGSTGLAEDVRYYGQWMRDEAEKRIGHLYPKVEVTAEMAQDRPDLLPYVGQQLTAIAWIWARTVASSSPVYQGIHVPLVRSYWLSRKVGKLAWIEPVVDRGKRTYRFVVRTGTPTDEQKKAIEAGSKLGRGCKFRCILSDEPIPESHIKTEGPGGNLGATLLAVVADGVKGRFYLSPDEVPHVEVDRPIDLNGIDVPLADDPRNLWCLGYGLNTFDKLFTSRQLIALTTFANVVVEARNRIRSDAARCEFPNDDKSLADFGTGAAAYADAITTYLAFAQSKACNRNTSLCVWETKMDRLVATFGRQALPMVWDFAETNPFAGAGGDIYGTVDSVCEVLDKLVDGPVGTVNQTDATADLISTSRPLVSTDPPYYDNIGYADLSDFFYVWLRRTLAGVFPKLLTTVLTPKAQELIATPYRHDGDKLRSQQFFEDGLGKAFASLQRSHDGSFPLTIYYAFKQAESDETEDEGDEVPSSVASTGWETMLEGVRRAGFSVTGTWPIRTEQPKGLRAYNQNSLASSIVLVCRLRPDNASLATRKDFITALRRELPEALRNLQRGNIAPVDLAQAAIGPGMAVFTRYAKVLESDGAPMTVRTSLGLINQTLDEVLAEQEGEFDGDTRWALAWFEQFAMDDGPFGDAETLSKAKNTAVNGLEEARIISARAGKVRLVKRDELSLDWNPTTDKRLTVWEVTQHLIHRLDQKGETGAAELVAQLGGIAEVSRDLAYRLYSTCERKKWAQEALAYNSLVVAWPELTKLARQEQSQRDRQTGFNFSE